MAKSGIFLSVMIPAYNEVANFKAGVLQPVVEYLHQQKYSWEAVFVDDGSTDATPQLLDQFCKGHPGFRLLWIKHGGKAAAVTAGMLAAKGEIILFTDFDQSTPLSEMSKFISQHQLGADVVIGNRTQTRQDTVWRKIRGWAFVTLVQFVALPDVVDSQCGFKSFTRPAANKIFSSLKVSLGRRVTGGYMGAFDVEALFLARKWGYKIAQIPVSWIKVYSDKLNIWKEPWLMAVDTFKVRLYDILGRYGK